MVLVLPRDDVAPTRHVVVVISWLNTLASVLRIIEKDSGSIVQAPKIVIFCSLIYRAMVFYEHWEILNDEQQERSTGEHQCQDTTAVLVLYVLTRKGIQARDNRSFPILGKYKLIYLCTEATALIVFFEPFCYRFESGEPVHKVIVNFAILEFPGKDLVGRLKLKLSVEAVGLAFFIFVTRAVWTA